MKAKILIVFNVVIAILLLWVIFSFVEVTAKNLHSEPISKLNAFSLITLAYAEEASEVTLNKEEAVGEELPLKEEETPPVASESESEVLELISLGEFKITAYCSCHKCCGKWAENRPIDADGNEIVYTASGAVAEAGKTVAVDTSVIPFGTTVVINGHEYIAQDTGSAVKGNVVDIYFDDHQQALNWGCQYLDVYVKEG